MPCISITLCRVSILVRLGSIPQTVFGNRLCLPNLVGEEWVLLISSTDRLIFRDIRLQLLHPQTRKWFDRFVHLNWNACRFSLVSLDFFLFLTALGSAKFPISVHHSLLILSLFCSTYSPPLYISRVPSQRPKYSLYWFPPLLRGFGTQIICESVLGIDDHH